MSQPDLSRILRNDGALYYNPTTFGANPTAPFGGKRMGFIQDVEVHWNIRTRRRRAPDTNRVYEIALSGQEAELSFTILQWDPELYSLGFPRVVSGTGPSGLQDMSRVEGAGQPRVLPVLNPILFAPNDPRNLAVLFLRPEPDPAVIDRMRLLLSEDNVTPLMFTATLNSNWNSLYVDKLEHMVLT